MNEPTLRKIRTELWQGECPTCGQKFEAKYEGQARWQVQSHKQRHDKQ